MTSVYRESKVVAFVSNGKSLTVKQYRADVKRAVEENLDI